LKGSLFDEQSIGRSCKGVCQQPEIQQHCRYHGSHERHISRCSSTSDGKQIGGKVRLRKNKRLSNVDETARSKNYRNGYSKKVVKTQIGEIPVKITRDRNGEYEPKIKK
jgi:hypothetical protein